MGNIFSKVVCQAILYVWLILLFQPLISYTYFGFILPGDPVRGISARTSAMGNISVACIKNEPNLYFNPASLTYLSNRQISLTLNYMPIEERIIRENQPSILNFQNYTFSSVSFLIPFKFFSFGTAVFPLYDMNYKFERKIWDKSILIQHHKLNSMGSLHCYLLSGAYKMKKISLGVGINFLKAGHQQVSEIYDYQYNIYTSTKSSDKLNGLNITSSFIFELAENILFGFSYTHETTLRKQNGSELKLPIQYAFSTTINVEEELPSTVALELIFAKNKKTEFHLGVEHLTFKEIPIRYGFGFIPHPVNDKYYIVSISVGSGIEISKNLFLDFSCSYENLNIKNPPTVPILQNIPMGNYIQQNSYKLVCSTKMFF